MNDKAGSTYSPNPFSIAISFQRQKQSGTVSGSMGHQSGRTVRRQEFFVRVPMLSTGQERLQWARDCADIGSGNTSYLRMKGAQVLWKSCWWPHQSSEETKSRIYTYAVMSWRSIPGGGDNVMACDASDWNQSVVRLHFFSKYQCLEEKRHNGIALCCLSLETCDSALLRPTWRSSSHSTNFSPKLRAIIKRSRLSLKMK